MDRLLVLAALVLCATAGTAHAQTTWASGVATFTGELGATSTSGGACGYGTLSSSMFPGMVLTGVSLSRSPLSKLPLKGCGSCLEIKCRDKACSSNTLTVMVHDDCDDCGKNQINLEADAFAKLAPTSLGRVPVQVREVPCDFDNNVVIGIDQFRQSGGGWVRMAFKGVSGPPLKSAEILTASGNKTQMHNTYGAAFEASKLPNLPWDIKLTNVNGTSVTLKNAVTVIQIGEIKTNANF